MTHNQKFTADMINAIQIAQWLKTNRNPWTKRWDSNDTLFTAILKQTSMSTRMINAVININCMPA